jgi:hypothetical protein
MAIAMAFTHSCCRTSALAAGGAPISLRCCSSPRREFSVVQVAAGFFSRSLIHGFPVLVPHCGDGKKRHPLRRSSSSCCRRRSLVHSSKTMTLTSVQRRLIALLALAGVSFTFFPWTYLDGWASSTCSSCGCTTRIVIHCLEEEEALATPVYIAIKEIHGNSRPF